MFKLARHAMRTRFEIVILDDLDPADARAACEESFDEIDRVEAQLSAYRADSELSRLHTEGAQGAVRVEPRFFRLLDRALVLCAETDGAFDMTVGPLLREWGFQKQSHAFTEPSADALAAARALVGMRANVLLDSTAGAVRLTNPGVRLDPGAIGKGYALDRAAKLLREAGIVNALMHGGTSSVVALGAPPGEKAWPVALQHPLRPDELLAKVALGDGESLSVSGVHGKSFEASGKRYGHVIDPRTGWPVENALLSAVVAASATDTDALSTGLLVLGEAGLDLLRERRPDASLLLMQRIDETETGRVATRGGAFSLTAKAGAI